MLYIEKEGFLPILEASKLAEKYDIGVMSCKGMSVTAARMLIDKTCARYGIPLLILHDFDISGFSIAKTLCSDTRRYAFKSAFKIINLGLQLDDVRERELESEPVEISNNSGKKRETLRRNGATEDEIEFLLSGRRVELNAMSSDQFIDFIENKLEEHGITKVVSAKGMLEDTFRLFTRNDAIKAAVTKAIKEMPSRTIDIPDDLDEQVRDYLEENPECPWEEAVAEIAKIGGAR